MEFNKESFIAHGILIKDQHILLLKRAQGRYEGGLWDIPGGTVEAQETPEEAVVREFKEEVRLEVQVKREIVRRTNMDTKGRPILFITITYLVDLLASSGNMVVISHEHEDYQWVALDQVPLFPTVPHVLPAMKTLLQTN